MKIVMRSQPAGEWTPVEPAVYAAEAELQSLLAETPSLVPITDIRPDVSPLLVSVREVGLPGSGNTDLLLVSAQGDIALVECKLASNPEIKRKVIGQIFEYGAFLWRMSYEELDALVVKRRGQPLAELVADAAGKSDAEVWDEEEFRSGVTDALRDGAFTLVIAVDEINDELLRTVQFLNSSGDPAFSFAALEMRRFQQGTAEILVPHLHGPGVAEPSKSRDGHKQTAKRAFMTPIVEHIQKHASGAGFGSVTAPKDARVIRVRFPSSLPLSQYLFMVVRTRAAKLYVALVSRALSADANHALIEVVRRRYADALTANLPTGVGEIVWHSREPGASNDRCLMYWDGAGYEAGDPQAAAEFAFGACQAWLKVLQAAPVTEVEAAIQEVMEEEASPDEV